MTDSMDHVDPELQSLLADIAVDGESTLFRTSASQRKRILFPTDREARATSAQISKAERHLLMVHRGEVAQLLYTSAQRLILEDPAFGTFINTSDTAGRDLRLPDPANWKRRAEVSSVRHKDAKGEVRAGQDLIDHLCSGAGRATPRELLEACMRVLPADRVRVTLAVDYLRRGADAQAEALTLEVLASEPSSMIRSYAWQHMGFIECRRNSYDKAMVAYEASADACSERVAPLTSMFFVAVQAGHLDGALRATGRLDDSVDRDHLAVRSHIEAQQAARQRGDWRMTAAAREIIRSSGDSLGEAGDEIVKHGFQEN
ncbi:MAG: hypothetical protein ACI8QZ_004032 [Chlamydiales bacterium]|jgi:hypothetical protein